MLLVSYFIPRPLAIVLYLIDQNKIKPKSTVTRDSISTLPTPVASSKSVIIIRLLLQVPSSTYTRYRGTSL